MAALEEVSSTYSTSDEEPERPPINKKAKFAGSFKYKCCFSREWKKVWPFVSAVPESARMFRCNVCLKNLSCAHQGAKDVKEHVATKMHQRLAKAAEKQPKLVFHSDPLGEKVRH